MKYLLMFYGNEQAIQAQSKEAVEQVIAAYGAYGEALKKAGVILGSNRLRPTNSASTVRVADGKTQVLDGPYAETKDQLLGFYVVDCNDLDAALDVARDLAAANPGGAYEIRPVGMLNPGSMKT